MNKPITKITEPEEIPEVEAFLEAAKKLEEFKAQYPGLFEEMDELVHQYNTSLQAADKAVRDKKVSCGPFQLYQYQTKYDAEAFYDAVGRDDFLKLGGQIETVPSYDVNKSTFEAMAAQGKIPQSIIDVVVKITPRYKTPDPLKIP